MKDNKLKGLLDKHIGVYLNNIAHELEEKHDRWFDDFGFPLFGETSKQYFEQVYFQSYLESYTRQMINSILQEIFDEEVPYEIGWPEFEYNGIYRGYTNIECEKEFGFEFINRETNVGYRYTFFQFDEIEGLLKKGNVEKIVLVIWENKDEIIGIEYGDDRVQIILLWDLFHELFDESDEEIKKIYDLFIKEVASAVKEAQSLISLTTLPGFTPSYLYKTRNETIANVKKEVEQLTCFHVDNDDFKSNETDSKELIDLYNLSEYFFNNRFENVFVGISDFAKSYRSSEYLYQYFKDNPLFDYTPIVSGYLKSIEQLLHAIYASYLTIKRIQKDLSEYTLGKYITDIKRERIFRREIVPAKDIIIRCLNSYRAESRNNLFHKDYLKTWDKVEQIRTNTVFLYVVLLGAVDRNIISNDPSVLGILNIEYDQLFNLITENDSNYFSFVLNGKEYLGMSKEPRYKGLVFNENGLITNTMKFKRLIYDRYETVELSRDNMPSEVWTSDVLLGNKIRKIWPME